MHLALTNPGHIKVIIGSTEFEFLTADKVTVGSRTTVPIWMTVPDGPLRDFKCKRMIIVKERVVPIQELEDGSAETMARFALKNGSLQESGTGFVSCYSKSSDMWHVASLLPSSLVITGGSTIARAVK